MRRTTWIVLTVAAVAVGGGAFLWAGGVVGDGGEDTVAFADVQQIFTNSCAGCHPVIVSSLDLTEGKSYAEIVGVRSIEAPTLPYVVAGDPDGSFLYLKVAGWPGNHGNPIIGARMPFGSGPLEPAELDTIRRWIAQGAIDESGRTRSADEVPTPGQLAALPAGEPPAALQPGDGRIEGTITGADHQPIAGAVVAMLVVRSDLPGGEEHYLAGVTGADGRYAIDGAPVGRVEIKAYAPGTTYVSRLLETAAGTVTEGDVGLPVEAIQVPTIADARVGRVGEELELSMDVQGAGLDRNYTLAVNADSGRVFELAAAAGGEEPGRWSRTVPAEGLTGSWTFMAVSHSCTVSQFLTATASA